MTPRPRSSRPDDPRVTTSNVTFKGVTGDVKAYLAKPKAEGKHGAVVVVHAVGGMSPHIQDIARRLAVDGFIALSVDFLSPVGGTPVPRNPEVASLTRQLKPEETTGNAVAAANYLRSLPESNGKIGSVGFCWGGGVVNRLAVADPMLNVGVPFYGAPPPAEDVPKIKAAMLINFADPALDKTLGMQAPGYEAALKKAGTRYEMRFYPGASTRSTTTPASATTPMLRSSPGAAPSACSRRRSPNPLLDKKKGRARATEARPFTFSRLTSAICLYNKSVI
jgi:carboxymethylenebutenolidase